MSWVVLIPAQFIRRRMKSNSPMNYTDMHSAAVDPRLLLKGLMEQAKLNPNSLAVATRLRVRQPTIYRFITGESKEPKRSTLLPVAEVLGVPVEAFFDPKLAEQVARERGLTDTGGPDIVGFSDGRVTFVAEAKRTYPSGDALEAAIGSLAVALSDRLPSTRRAVGSLLASLAEDPSSAEEVATQIRLLMQSPGKRTGTGG